MQDWTGVTGQVGGVAEVKAVKHLTPKLVRFRATLSGRQGEADVFRRHRNLHCCHWEKRWWPRAIESVSSISGHSTLLLSLTNLMWAVKVVPTLLWSHQKKCLVLDAGLLNVVSCMVQSEVLKAIDVWIHAGNKARAGHSSSTTPIQGHRAHSANDSPNAEEK